MIGAMPKETSGPRNVLTRLFGLDRSAEFCRENGGDQFAFNHFPLTLLPIF